MLRLLERNIASIERRLVLLAPPQSSLGAFTNVTEDAFLRHQMIRDMQRVRGGIYLEDGAVKPQHLSADGRHQTPEDLRSWHLLMLNKDQKVSACAWYLEHEPTVTMDNLRVRHCPLNHDAVWAPKLKNAVQAEIDRARRDGLRYAEVGGWAVAKECRCTSEGLALALAAYSLGRILGGALGMTTATVRHSSSTILQRIGGSHLETDGESIPPYYDSKYECDIELLRFDSRKPNPKYAVLVESLKHKLANVPVIANPISAPLADSVRRAFRSPEPLFAA
jgi:hypothetical protein